LFESVRRAALRYLSGDDFAVVSKFVRDRSGTLDERLMKELGRSADGRSSLEGTRLAVKEGEEEVVDDALDAGPLKPCLALL